MVKNRNMESGIHGPYRRQTDVPDVAADLQPHAGIVLKWIVAVVLGVVGDSVSEASFPDAGFTQNNKCKGGFRHGCGGGQ
jgi:hypothetical protein